MCTIGSMDIHEAWCSIQPAVMKILEVDLANIDGRSLKVPTKNEYIMAKRAIYDFCTMNSKNFSPVNGADNGTGKSKIQGKELYDKVREILIEHSKHNRKEVLYLRGEELLDKYREMWCIYEVICSVIDHLFDYLNKHCVPRSLESNMTNYFDVYTLAVYIWREFLYTPLKSELVSGALQMIRHDRNGDLIRKSSLKAFLDSLDSHFSLKSSYVTMGLQNKEHQQGLASRIDFQPLPNVAIYEQDFEAKFIQETREFFEKEGTSYLSSGSVSDYVIKALARLDEEEDRIRQYLHESTRSKLADACNEAILMPHQEVLQGEASKLLEAEKSTELKRLYTLLRRIPVTLHPLKEQVEEHILKQVLSEVAALGKIGTSSEDAKTYIETLLNLHEKYFTQINIAFEHDSLFLEALNSAFKNIVNQKSSRDESTSGKTPELLAKYCDSLLKRGSKVEADQLDAVLSRVMSLFEYLEDKDVFEKFYKKFFAKRLITNSSVSDDAEAMFLSKLKASSGHDFTQKLQRMYNDIGTSRELNNKFKQHLVNSGTSLSVDFHVQVLTSHSWPFNAQLSVFLPPVLAYPIERFVRFYQNEHQGRKLMWTYQLCKGELLTTYLKKPFVFQANLIQMVVLLAFNTAQMNSRDELYTTTGVDPKQLNAQIDNLKRMKIIKEEGSDLKLNDKYSYKKLKIKIDQPVKSEEKEDSEATHKLAHEYRRMALEACIVRIMKARRRMTHTTLIQEVIEQVQARFKPDIPMIKKQIESLIEKEFLRRGQVRTEYEYVA